MALVRNLAAQGRLDKALDHVADELAPGDLLYHLESGLLLHLMGRYEESDRQLDVAELLVEELYTRSLSREGLSYLLNETVLPYEGESYERILIHYYRAMNHLHMGDGEGALVEARKVNLRLADAAWGLDEGPVHELDPLAQYLTGLLYEAGGQLNDAVVSYRSAREGFAAYEGHYGIVEPPWLATDLYRLAPRVGLGDLFRQLEEEGIDGGEPDDAEGEVILLFENGWISPKEEFRLRVPLLSHETELEPDEFEGLAVTLGSRYDSYRNSGVWLSGDYEIEYWLEVALPDLPPRPPEPIRSARLRSGAQSATAVLLQDLDAVSRDVFEANRGKIFLKAAGRALLKYLAHRVAKKEGGELVGLLANVAGIATERADTRGWSTLPREIHMARLPLDAGRHVLSLELLGAQGEVLDVVDLGDLELSPGEMYFLNWRSLPSH